VLNLGSEAVELLSRTALEGGIKPMEKKQQDDRQGSKRTESTERRQKSGGRKGQNFLVLITSRHMQGARFLLNLVMSGSKYDK
jgi:hypothetical protein